ncbi:type VI immunity family protein [Pyxidicoccus sp. 3LFB2]
MHRPHPELARSVLRSIETYRRAVGPHALRLQATPEGEWEDFDERGWGDIRRKMLEEPWAYVGLTCGPDSEEKYLVDYKGRPLDPSSILYTPEQVCSLSFWFPTEFLEQHGPQKMRELFMELATPLPLCSGNAGLSFLCNLDEAGVSKHVRKYCFRYPGMGLSLPTLLALDSNRTVGSPSWLTFLGQPVLGELGGVSGLRSRLHTPGTTVQELEGDRAVVTLGPWPEAGDTEQGKDLPAYRELARVLEPWTLWGEGEYVLNMNPDDARRWERRFLD